MMGWLISAVLIIFALMSGDYFILTAAGLFAIAGSIDSHSSK